MRHGGSNLVIYWFYHQEDSSVVYIADAKHGSIAPKSFSREISIGTVTWLTANGKCMGCGFGVLDLSVPCTCSHTPDVGGHLCLTVPGEGGESSFRDILDKMIAGARKELRRNLLENVVNTLTEKEVDLLLQWQRSMCYYCAEPFAVGNNGPVFHRDHFIALVDGGPTTLNNTVLSCPRCNAQKGRMGGDDFVRLILSDVASDRRERIVTLQRAVRSNLAKHERHPT